MAIGSSLSKLFNTAGTSKPQTGTGYTNLNKFLGANQGNQLGQKVAGSLQTQIGGVKSQLGEQQNQFQTEAEKNKLDTEENKQKRDEVIGRFSSASSAGAPLSDEDVSKVTQYRGGTYAGPTGLKDTSALSQQAQDLAGQTTNLSPSGTQELLRRTIGGGRYTQGQQKLDSLLMDRSGLKQVGREAQTLGSDVNRANLAAQGQAQALKGQAAQFGQETTGKLQGALTGLDTEAQGQLAAAQAAENQRLANTQAIQDFASGKIAKKDASGNVMKDAYGNTIYDTVDARGGTTGAGQLDYLSNLVKQSGANEAEFQQLFGKGGFAEATAAADAIKQQASAQFQPDIDKFTQLKESMERNHPDYARSQSYRNTVKQLNDAVARRNAMLAQIPNVAEGRGIAGQALSAGQQEALFKNLASTVANSGAAQNLTQQGVASQPLRSNYAALAQLLGTPDINPYTSTDQYQAGQVLLNPDQLKRSLGY